MSTDIQTRSVPQPRVRGSWAVAVAAVTSASMAVIYLLIGLKVVEVIRPDDDQPAFGFTAAAFFATLAVVLMVFRRPIVWLGATAVHLFVAYAYYDLAAQRVPDIETWGITLRIIQIPALLALGYLLMRGGRRERT